VSELRDYLERPLAPADPVALAAIEDGPMDPSEALDRRDLDRLLDPAPLAVETGWCALADGSAYVAVRTPMLGVTGEMVDWWFDWHPEDPLRYQIWHPAAHAGNGVERPAVPGAKRHWGTVHHPIEDVGTGMVHARIAFRPPTAIGFSTDALEDARVATIVGGEVGDDRRRVWHTLMVHVWLNQPDGVVLRSRFWLGAGIRPFARPLAPLSALLNTRRVRRAALPAGLPHALARHCAEEYANLASLLPELHGRYA
jgi:hypothetical protein